MVSFTRFLSFTFIIKILSQSVYKYSREKYGAPNLRLCRGYEKLITRFEKNRLDIKFLLKCKQDGIIPKFARPKLSLQEKDTKLTRRIGILIVKAELKQKYKIERSLKKKISEASTEVARGTSYLFQCALRYRIRLAVCVKKQKWQNTHRKKLEALKKDSVAIPSRHPPTSNTANVVHNFSSYDLSEDERRILSFSLDHYIAGKDRGMRTKAEFERFYQSILNSTDHLSHLPERERINLKAKFIDTYNKYSTVRLPEEHERVLNGLYRNRDIVILRQDKGRGVVILDKTIYVSKGEEFLSGPEFVELDEDPTKSFQDKVQRTLLEMKKCFETKVYEKIYPSSARPGLYYGLAKVHKIANQMSGGGSPEERSNAAHILPLRPVISNIGTATYELSRYLAGVLKPLTKSEYSVESSKDFVDMLSNKSLPPGFSLVSFDVVSLFTKVPLDFTIDLILKKIYDDKAIVTKISRQRMKKLLLICTKEMHFNFNGRIYQQIDGVAMGSPLGPVIANIFMSELEQTLVPTLSEDVSFWTRYVDDTFAFVRQGSVERVLECLNGFHPSIQFTHESEVEGKISFLDVKVSTREDRGFDTEIHRKKTDTNVYIHWNAFAPKAWKIGTLKGLVRRAFTLCSTEDARNKEIIFLKKVFRGINGYPSRVVTSIIREVQQKFDQENASQANVSSNDLQPDANEAQPVVDSAPTVPEEESKPFIILPYKGKEGEIIVRKFRTALNRALPGTVKPQIVYTGTQISNFFRVKDRVPLEHQSDLVYRFRYQEATRYVGETKVRHGQRNHEHLHTDKNSAIYKFLRSTDGIVADNRNFEILETGLKNTVTRKLAESLYIKEYNPDLPSRSYKLFLFN